MAFILLFLAEVSTASQGGAWHENIVPQNTTATVSLPTVGEPKETRKLREGRLLSTSPSITVTNANNVKKQCQFPFTFNNVTHTACTVDGAPLKGQAWCSTETSTNGTHVTGKGEYGYCFGGPSITVTNTNNVKKQCQFPFTFNNVTHNACTVDAAPLKGQAWCSTETSTNSTHVTGKGEYGYCLGGEGQQRKNKATGEPTITGVLRAGSTSTASLGNVDDKDGINKSTVIFTSFTLLLFTV